MDRFIAEIKQKTQGEILGDLEIVRIPLDIYRARNATNRRWLAAGPSDHPFAHSRSETRRTGCPFTASSVEGVGE
ncbi:MAG TPA: hypothetical protein VGK69_05610 [Gaiellaceae bacterium]